MKILLLLLVFSGFCFAAQKKLDNKPAPFGLHSFCDNETYCDDYSSSSSAWLDINMRNYVLRQLGNGQERDRKELEVFKKDLEADMGRYSTHQRPSELENFQIKCIEEEAKKRSKK